MTLGLKYLNLSHCKLPIDALKHLLLGLACNEVTSDVELNISNNNIGGAGAGVVENALPGDLRVTSVTSEVSSDKRLLSLIQIDSDDDKEVTDDVCFRGEVYHAAGRV